MNRSIHEILRDAKQPDLKGRTPARALERREKWKEVEEGFKQMHRLFKRARHLIDTASNPDASKETSEALAKAVEREAQEAFRT